MTKVVHDEKTKHSKKLVKINKDILINGSTFIKRQIEGIDNEIVLNIPLESLLDINKRNESNSIIMVENVC